MRITASLFSMFLALAASVAACATVDDVDAELDELDAAISATGDFDVWQGDGGKWFFRLSASNGFPLLTSEAYESRTSSLEGLLSVLDNGGIETRYAVKVGTDHKHYVSLRATNGATIAVAQGYRSHSNAKRAIRTMVAIVSAYVDERSRLAGARIDTYSDAAGKFRFTVYAGNGERVLASQAYTSEASALNGAFLVTEHGARLANFRIVAGANGNAHFQLVARNGEVIAVSEVYSTAAAAQRAVNAVVALVPTLSPL